MARITCQTCGQEFDVREGRDGRSTRCPQCGGAVVVAGHREGRLGRSSWSDSFVEPDQERLEQRFDRLFRALLEYERQAPALKT